MEKFSKVGVESITFLKLADQGACIRFHFEESAVSGFL